jgi:CubicO group peptidase (beta-lactamase class C family)
MTYRALLAVAAALISVALPGAAPAAGPDAQRAALDRDMPGLLAGHRIPSVSIAHIENGRIVLAAAYGEQRPGVPATTDGLYNIASLTKPISAEVLLRLASTRRIALDEPMHPHWADPDIVADARHKQLTPRIALSHRTGFLNWRWLEKDKRLALHHAPGERAGYSGEGYEYVARFAEKRTGIAFDILADRLVFGPLGMRDTAYTEKPWFRDRVAVPTDGDGNRIEPVRRTRFSAADDVHSTASDYARFMIGVMTRQGLTSDIAAERERVQASTRHVHCTGAKEASCPVGLGFGLGWEVHEYPGQTFLFHTGADEGEFAVAYLNLATRTGSVILTNSSHGHAVVIDILDRLGTDVTFMRALRAQAGK